MHRLIPVLHFLIFLLLAAALTGCISSTPDLPLPSPTSPEATINPSVTPPDKGETNLDLNTTLLPTSSPVPSPTPEPRRPDTIIFIIVDALRPDHLSGYGYERSTSPNLDKLIIARGVRFSHAVSTSSWTCPSNAAVMTGLLPIRIGASFETMSKSLPSKYNTLAEYLHSAGYYTAGFVNSGCTNGGWGFKQGFDWYDDSVVDRKGITAFDKETAEMVNQRVLNWLEQKWPSKKRGDQPLFMFIYYTEPHTWYAAPPPFENIFDPDYSGPVTAEVFRSAKPVITGELSLTERDEQHVMALYDSEIAYWDNQFGKLMDALQQRGMLDNTLMIITSDHGEQFGEHGIWAHGDSLYEEVLRTPLLMIYPGQIPKNVEIDVPVSTIDIMPTILDWAGAALPPGLDAVSLRPALQGQWPAEARSLFSELDAVTDPNHWAYYFGVRFNMRSVQQGQWKLIHHVGNQAADELYLLGDSSLYETTNLITQEAERARKMLEELERIYKP